MPRVIFVTPEIIILVLGVGGKDRLSKNSRSARVATLGSIVTVEDQRMTFCTC